VPEQENLRGSAAGNLNTDLYVLEATPRPQHLQGIESCLLPERLTQDFDERLSAQIAQHLPVPVVVRHTSLDSSRETTSTGAASSTASKQILGGKDATRSPVIRGPSRRVPARSRFKAFAAPDRL